MSAYFYVANYHKQYLIILEILQKEIAWYKIIVYKCWDWVDNKKKDKKLERDQNKEITYVAGFYRVLYQNSYLQVKGSSYLEMCQY